MKDKKMIHKEIRRETTLDKTVGKRDQLGGTTKVKYQQEETMKRLCLILKRHTKMIRSDQIKHLLKLSANVLIKLKSQLNQLNGTNQIWNRLNQARQKKKAQSDQAPIELTRVVPYPEKGKQRKTRRVQSNQALNKVEHQLS